MPKKEMRKTFKKTCALVLSLALSISAFSAVPDVQAAKKAKKITLNATKKTLKVGKKFTLKVKKVTPKKANKKVTWKSSKKSVATVSSKGVVTAKAPGKAKITAVSKSNKKAKATCTITVEAAETEAVPSASAAVSAAPAATTQAAVPTPTPVITPTPTPTPDPESIKANADFLVGTVVNPTRIADEEFTKLVSREFDIVTFENEMKGYSLMDTQASQASGNETEPVCRFEQADSMVEWAIANGLRVRGHVLFWENSMASSFFYKGYNTSNELVDKDTLIQRMKSYATQVVTHFETKYPNTVIGWDVVNEAIDAGGAADKTTGLHLYTSGNFYKILGGEYIKYAFLYANEAVKATGKDIPLFYNDFNCFSSPKTSYIVELIDYLNADPNNKLLPCIGMEGYITMTFPGNMEEFGKAMRTFTAKGVKVGVNEMCVRLSPETASNKRKGVTDADRQTHIKRCTDVFTEICKFYKEQPDSLTNVSMWGLLDRPDLLAEKDKPEAERNYDYTVYGTESGLFTENYEKKEAFNKVLAVLKSYKS